MFLEASVAPINVSQHVIFDRDFCLYSLILTVAHHYCFYCCCLLFVLVVAAFVVFVFVVLFHSPHFQLYQKAKLSMFRDFPARSLLFVRSQRLFLTDDSVFASLG